MTQHECGLDITYCEQCREELEVGQTGKCDSCQEESASPAPASGHAASPSEKSTYLFCTEGGSNKEYHAHLRAKDGGWVVDYANGPRGKVGQSKAKTAQPLRFEDASKVFNDLVKSKTKTGYTECESGVRFTNTENSGRASGHAPQLPSSISKERADELVEDDEWGAQEKANGERRAVRIGEQVRGINKLGLYVNIPETWVMEFRALGDAMFDGEHVGDTLYVFDLLELDGKDIRHLPFNQRYALMEQMLDGMGNVVPSMKLLKAAFTTEEKRALAAEIESTRREGLVFKMINAAYDSGRIAMSLKYKLLEASTCIVLSKNVQRSVQIGLLNAAGNMVPVGNVTILANFAVPAENDLVEVEYLYYNPGGAFEQATYLGPRNDILREEALLSQVTRLKPGVAMDENGRPVYS